MMKIIGGKTSGAILLTLFSFLFTQKAVHALTGVDILSYELTTDAFTQDCTMITNG